ncbi:hypothetical protein [Helicobacter canis]|uniref:hypothetical protein n=1 Tax=Helicobacter canis TaxID=29419 RepID=UPI00294389DB|nr:hypothetical protein [Helicobacter canis]
MLPLPWSMAGILLWFKPYQPQSSIAILESHLTTIAHYLGIDFYGLDSSTQA